ncbi:MULTISPECIES: TetR/AcrR family transcriptional regulator [unclassified Streptomyces]|uniref:TetR/AcrR family transcriptional regulator n=1 Tax=unclassified Streptomyces TaxID=2593676 RepID=UPI0038130AFE
MPPARGDHEARRQDVSEAVWQVLAAKGFAGLTLRAVAAEMGASTGLLMHYFPTKRALVAHALGILEQRTAERPRRERPSPGLASLRAVLIDILPLAPDAADRNRIWVASWDVALSDDGLGRDQAERYARMRDGLRTHLDEAVALGELPPHADPGGLAATAVAFVHGLVVQALFDPAALPPARQTALVDDFLAGLRAPRTGSADPTAVGPAS